MGCDSQFDQYESENRWAVEAAMKSLSDAIRMAREAQRKEQASDERELDRLLCPGCFSQLPKAGSMHMWIDGSNIEACLATDERKRRIKEYFAKNNPIPR
jgi:hypothetical protein